MASAPVGPVMPSVTEELTSQARMNYCSCCTSSGPPSSPWLMAWLLVCMVRWPRESPRLRTGCAVARLEAARDPYHRAAGIPSSADLVEHTDHVLDVNVVRDIRKVLRFQ